MDSGKALEHATIISFVFSGWFASNFLGGQPSKD
jgi:hypothetical protein